MERPNIFKYATSELSQDAMICYLLEWAKKENQILDENAHNIGVKLLDSFFDKYKDSINKPEIYSTIQIEKQDNNIDVLCIVNEKYPIIIEDKTNTNNHGDQLERYLKYIKSKEEFEEKNIMCIYFKTYDQSSYQEIENSNYKVFSRKEILQVLNSFSTDNIIINDYKEYLQKIENDVNSFITLPIENWHWNSWKGFFIKLKEELNDGNWKYVANPTGGFLGYWFNWKNIENDKYSIYFQIEYYDSKNVKFNIKLYNSEKSKIPKEISNKYIYGEKKILKDYGTFKFVKPNRVSSGRSMTIGNLDKDFMILNGNKTINFNATVENIRNIMQIIS